MKITYYGHSSLGIQIKNAHILIDPFITGNPKASHIDIELLDADYILLTHAHQDHTLDAEAIARSTGAVIVANYEITLYYNALGLETLALNPGGKYQFDFGFVKGVNAIHTSSFPDGNYGGIAGGFVITAESKSVYIAGDTALTLDMKLIPMFATIDLAMLPIGDVFTMGIEEAIIASDFVACSKILGCHYDTFPPIEIDKKEAIATFKKKGKELLLLEIGKSIDL